MDVLPIQPSPVASEVRSLPFPGGHVATMVRRAWKLGDTFVCRLCEQCTANHDRGTCSVLVDRDVAQGSAATFSTRGLSAFGLAADHRDARADRA
jgi:hypothetical protein